MISGANTCKSFRKTFKGYRKLTVTTLYILVVSCYINMKQNITNRGLNIRIKLNFHLHFCSPLAFHNSVANVAIKLNNKLPDSLKNWVIIFIPSIQLKSFIFFNKLVGNLWDYSLVIFNSCIRLLWMYFIVVLHWTVYRNYCFCYTTWITKLWLLQFENFYKYRIFVIYIWTSPVLHT